MRCPHPGTGRRAGQQDRRRTRTRSHEHAEDADRRVRRAGAAPDSPDGKRPRRPASCTSSLSSLGWVCGGAATVVRALLDALGDAGTPAGPPLDDGARHTGLPDDFDALGADFEEDRPVVRGTMSSSGPSGRFSTCRSASSGSHWSTGSSSRSRHSSSRTIAAAVVTRRLPPLPVGRAVPARPRRPGPAARPGPRGPGTTR
ncbi:AAC(3) family N-acetyltransferase [Streptomyces sp. NBC_01298]|uniref:AAC(3) family N-acetyltransferase n=1 Tax=Streptomyces sp. NBC_01298 TaxID=2903817 RepID=UPI003FA35F5D